MDYPPICPFCGVTLNIPYEFSIGKHYGCYNTGKWTRGFTHVDDWMAMCWENGKRIAEFYAKEKKEYRPSIGNG
jgi:hypothetical protein